MGTVAARFNKYHEVEAYCCEGKVSFRDPGGHAFKTEPKGWVEQTVDRGCGKWFGVVYVVVMDVSPVLSASVWRQSV